MRYPFVRQHDASDCGPAVLSMIAAYHGKRQSIAKLREMAGTDLRGTNLAGLITAAERIGFRARGVRATPEALKEIPLPAIAHWVEGQRTHFVVVYAITKKRITIGDPASGLRNLPPEGFKKHWTGVLILLNTTDGLRALRQSPTALGRLTGLLLPHRKLFLDALVAAVLMTILALSSSFFIQALVDFVFVVGRTPTLNWLGLGMLLVLVARVVFLGLRNVLLAHLSQRIDAETVLGYTRHLLGLPLTFFVSRRTGEILSRLNDAVKIRVAISATMLSVLVDAILVITTAAIMAFINWRLSLLSLSLLPLLGLAVWILSRPMKRQQRLAMEKGAELEAHVVESIAAIQTVKAFRAEDRIQGRTEARFLEVIDASFRSQMYALHSSTISSFLVGLAGLGLLWFGGRQVLAGTLTVGQLMGLYTMLGTILAPVERLANANPSIQDAVIAAERLGEVLELDRETDRQRSTALDRSIEGSIEFCDVTFRYGARAPVFENVNLKIAVGESVGIAGESGCGKTTLASLLGRFFEPASGRVLIDGIDVRDYSLECLRREIAYVPQEIVLLNGSIADNIRLGHPDAAPDRIRAAARAAHIDEFVERLPLGYDTIVGERGLMLSGGERQRVAIARALLAEAPILILDEPTSHLDAHSEIAVQSLVDQRRGRRTTIVISHRPLDVDRTIYIDRLAIQHASLIRSW